MSPDDVIRQLGYSSRPEHWITQADASEVVSHLWRAARDNEDIHVEGSYVFRTSPGENPMLPARPAIHVVTATTDAEARAIRKKLWNLGTAPFLIIILPNRVRVYRGFDYDREKNGDDAIAEAQLSPAQITEVLHDFYAREIDSGRIWQTQSQNLTPEKRVDQRLLRNLEELGRILVEDKNLSRGVAHSLIGKYIYIYYLKSRDILTDEWLERYDIRLEDVVGHGASAKYLQTLIEALEARFNGKIFPLDFNDLGARPDEAVRFVASIFRGDSTSGQLALDFEIYDFSCIPVEMLSSIYEQFLHSEGKGKKEGAVYTREFVADYLLCELNSIKPLQKGMRILDPACGSGVFLALSYRRLIEQELRLSAGRQLSPEELAAILEHSIYGVEPILDACYVAEFSLILMLLSYVDPPELHQNEDFHFPNLHGRNIVHGDFFDDDLAIWQRDEKFDWVVGNPPWTKLKPNTALVEQKHAWDWMQRNSAQKPVGKYSLSEAFTWRSAEVLSDGGCVGLLTHAMSLFNISSTKYRQQFFAQHEVKRITNFANLAYVLFEGRADVPGATIIYSKTIVGREKPAIVHYGPFTANQAFSRTSIDKKKRAWTLTIYEDEIQVVDPYDAESGDGLVWKIALWGTYRDKKAIARFKRLFPKSLVNVVEEKQWHLHEGVEIRDVDKMNDEQRQQVTHFAELGDSPRLDVKSVSGRFLLTAPRDALHDIPASQHYIRTRGGSIGLKVTKAPHIFWGSTSAAYSDLDFVLPAPQIGISAPEKDADCLRAVSAYLNSSVGRYLLFFHCIQWGVDRNQFAPAEALSVPLPNFSEDQVEHLADLHRELSEAQLSFNAQGFLLSASDTPQGARTSSPSDENIKVKLDAEVERLLNIPEHLAVMARDFIRVRLQLNKGNATSPASQPAKSEELRAYAVYLRDGLDAFAGTHHKVSVRKYLQFVVCTVEITRSAQPIEPAVEVDSGEATEELRKLWESLEQPFSQWVYVQRGLRVLDGKQFHIWKTPRLIDWTRTQALLDSDDIIAEVLNYKGSSR